MLDTRRYRTPESTNTTDPAKSMLGRHQLAHLLKWIRAPPAPGIKWKIVVSSVPMTKNWHFGDMDTWGTYLVERQTVLAAMWESSAAQGVGIVVISGDRHEFAATRLKDAVPGRGGDVVEFSVSPLSMFYLPMRTYRQRDAEDEVIK
jgi:alkaline phosphatase D